ncbi:coronafacic acid synthetase [Myxococcaceae bacterium JPH2]|nr:coronafacic acid synthetase [Myxococcaceae bacterium JPH2]
MSSPSVGHASIVLRGSACVSGARPNPYAARVKGTVRYADPMSWSLVMAIGEAIAPLGDDFQAWATRCSLIQVGPAGPPEAMAQVASDALRGFASPVRFPSATPSAPAGLACIVHGIRGPTLALTLPVEEAVTLALHLSSDWLSRGVVEGALIAAPLPSGVGAPTAGCVLLARGEGPAVDVARVTRALREGTALP